MDQTRAELLDWIEQDKEELLAFLSGFIRVKSPNPPGDTRDAVRFICEYLEAQQLPFRLVDPQPHMPNIVASFDGGRPGSHLVLNGHIDVYPVGDEPWVDGPWSGAIRDGRVWGRGASDMKAGTAASILAFAYLHRVREQLSGRLTLTAVSDEETQGPWGSRYLIEHHPEVLGDCLLNGEPSSPSVYEFGEKGYLWLRLTLTTSGAHGAYTHLSGNAIEKAARLMSDLEVLTALEPSPPDAVSMVIEQIQEATERSQGEGAYAALQRVTVNVGVISGGLKVNMVPGHCAVEVDVRLPIGVAKDALMARVEEIAAAHPSVSAIEELGSSEPSSCDPHGEMAVILCRNVRELAGIEPTPMIGLGATDARLWRQRGIPAYVYGPTFNNMASADEYVEIEEFLHTLRAHVLSSYDYLFFPKE